MTRVIIDTGPLVALLNRRDRHHAWARRILSAVAPPVFTCEAVVSEACFLLGSLSGGSEKLLELVSKDIVRVDFQLHPEVGAIRELMRKFADVPMSFADACLVRMTELERATAVLTLDSDFQVYRRNRRQRIPLITPGQGRRR